MKRLIAVPCVVSLVLAACGGSGGRQIAIDDFHAEYLKATCAYFVRCGVAPDEPTCRSAFDLFATLSDTATLVSDVQAHKTNYDPVLAATCLDSYAGLACGGATDSDTCQKVFTGKTAAGQACVVDTECVTAQCTPTDRTCAAQCCPGTCAQTIPVGGACTADTDVCVEGSACDLDHVCVKPSSTPGAACAVEANCVAPLVCDSTMGCVRPAALGATCDPAGSFGCLDPLTTYCDPTSRTCAPRGKPADTCVVLNAATGISSCLTYASCDPTSLKCVAHGASGAACGGTTGVSCLGFLTCDATTHTCAAPPASTVCHQ